MVATAQRAIYLSSKNDSEDSIRAGLAKAAAAHPEFTWTSAGEWYRSKVAVAGGWSGYETLTARTFDFFIVPRETMGKATASIVTQALARRPQPGIELLDGRAVIDVEVVDSKNWQGGWRTVCDVRGLDEQDRRLELEANAGLDDVGDF
jgi:hypothetical protein